MKRSTLLLAAAAAAALLLSGCNITINPPLPEPDETVVASDDPTDVRLTMSLEAGERVLVRLNVPQTIRDRFEVVLLELSHDVALELLDPSVFGGRVVASSSSWRYYARGSAGISSLASDAVSATAIIPGPKCSGSCILIRSDSNELYARVTNTTGAALSIDAYFFGDAIRDTEEPNDTPASASVLDLTGIGGVSGALEFPRDEDFWRVPSAGNVLFLTSEESNPVGVRVQVVDQDGHALTAAMKPNTQFNVNANEYVRVYSAWEFAGVETSNYTLRRP